jgi:DNA-binding transcriptional ArsR family regulator
LSALGHITRLRVAKALLDVSDGLPAGKIAQQLNIRQNSLSPHLGNLARNQLIYGRRQGREIIYRIDHANVGRLARCMESILPTLDADR